MPRVNAITSAARTEEKIYNLITAEMAVNKITRKDLEDKFGMKSAYHKFREEALTVKDLIIIYEALGKDLYEAMKGKEEL